MHLSALRQRRSWNSWAKRDQDNELNEIGTGVSPVNHAQDARAANKNNESGGESKFGRAVSVPARQEAGSVVDEFGAARVRRAKGRTSSRGN